MNLIRKIEKILSINYGLITSSKRAVPDFIIIGAQKGGTTSLYEYLIQHPNIKKCMEKEVHFFDNNYYKGLKWYKAHFSKNLKTGEKTGEATPYYLFHPHAPYRIKEDIPDAKLIVLLRNPIERAYSHYRMMVRVGAETLSFDEAIKVESDRIDNELRKMKGNKTYYSFEYQNFSYLKRGLYVEQLQTWFKLFPKEKFLILNSEDFYKNTSDCYKRVIKFLQLPSWEPRSYEVFNFGNEKLEISEDTLQFLQQYYKPYNKKLYDLLGVKYDWN